MLGIRSCGVFLCCMWYTKKLLIYPYSYFDLAETLSSSYPPLVLRWLGMSTGTGSLPVARLPAELLPASETSVVAVDTLSVGVVNL
jgi:hypothetical protein